MIYNGWQLDTIKVKDGDRLQLIQYDGNKKQQIGTLWYKTKNTVFEISPGVQSLSFDALSAISKKISELGCLYNDGTALDIFGNYRCNICATKKGKFLSFQLGNAKDLNVCESCATTIISSAKANDWKQYDGGFK